MNMTSKGQLMDKAEDIADQVLNRTGYAKVGRSPILV